MTCSHPLIPAMIIKGHLGIADAVTFETFKAYMLGPYTSKLTCSDAANVELHPVELVSARALIAMPEYVRSSS